MATDRNRRASADLQPIGALGPFAPVLQTGLWVVLVGVGFLWCRPQLRKIVDALTNRIEGGSSFKAGPIEVSAELRKLDYVAPSEDKARPALEGTPENDVPLPPGPSNGTSPELSKAPEWVGERDQMYKDSRGVFLAHVLSPSKEAGQTFDIFVFLVRHKSADLSDVEFAEFFFGHYWGNRVFREDNKGRPIGVATSAYGPFLCTCRVRFRDGGEARLARYVDFEMAKVIPSMEGPANQALQRKAAGGGRR